MKSELSHSMDEYGGLQSLYEGYSALSHLLAGDRDELGSREGVVFLLDLLNKELQTYLNDKKILSD